MIEVNEDNVVSFYYSSSQTINEEKKHGTSINQLRVYI